jgi:hypothetical protein
MNIIEAINKMNHRNQQRDWTVAELDQIAETVIPQIVCASDSDLAGLMRSELMLLADVKFRVTNEALARILTRLYPNETSRP